MTIAGYIYLITNTVNGKKYVGCTSWTVQSRWKRHITAAKTGSEQLIHKAIRKYGQDSFSVECLETVPGTREDLLLAERIHVESLGCLVPLGYNLTPGGVGVDHSLPEFRERYLKAMSKVHADPIWQESVAEANRQKARDPLFQETMLKAMRKMHADPEYVRTRAESAQRMSADPEWQSAHAKRNVDRAKDPKWKAAHSEAMRSRAKDPEWRQKNLVAMQKLAKDPKWLAKVRENGKKSGATNTAKALARDAQVTHEERERRVKNRAYHAAWTARKKMKNA